MSRWPILVFAVVIAGCGKPEPTRPAATEPEAPGVAAAPPAAPDTLAPPAPPEAPKTAPTIPPPSDPVDRFSQALVDTKDCPRTDDGLLVANPTSCLVEVTAAREALIHPTSEVANTPAFISNTQIFS